MGEGIIPIVHTNLQKKVVSYGKQSIVGCAILVIVFALIGACLGVFAFFWAEPMDDETFDMWQLISCMYLVLMALCVFGVFYGQQLKRAAEDRDITKLDMLFLVWLALDLVLVAAIIVLVILRHEFQYLLVLVCAAVDAYRLRIIRKFIQECKADETYSA